MVFLSLRGTVAVVMMRDEVKRAVGAGEGPETGVGCVQVRSLDIQCVIHLGVINQLPRKETCKCVLHIKSARESSSWKILPIGHVPTYKPRYLGSQSLPTAKFRCIVE